MLLVFLTASFAVLGTSTGKVHQECYGQDFLIPETYSVNLYKGPLYFTPYKGGPRKILLDNREAKDPRIKISGLSVILTDLNEKDEGHFAVSFFDEVIDVITLKILDCADKKETYYGHLLELRVHSKAAFLEFTPLDSLEHPVILWNRTDPQISEGKRGKMKHNVWKISGVTQADNGYYNFRRKDRYLVSRFRVVVNGNTRFYDGKLKNPQIIRYPWMNGTWTVTFKPENKEEIKTVIKNGNKVWTDNPFFSRIEIMTDGFEIFPLQSTDGGSFEMRDPQGNLVLTAHLHIRIEDKITPITVTVAVVIFFLGVLCCYCFCCKKCCKRDKSTPQSAAAPAVHYHDSNQPTDPEYPAAPNPSAFPHQPVNSAVFKEPTNTSLEPPVYQPTNVDVNPSQSELAGLTDQGSAPAPSFGANLLSSTTEPRFELKGLSFLSAPPLTSDAPSCHVYMSEKLNFL